MKHAWQQWKTELAKRLSEALEADVSAEDIVTPPDPKMGDFAYGCFKLSKERKTSPAAIAQEAAEKLNLEHSDFASAAAAGPYVNVALNAGDAVHRVVREIELAGDGYGKSKQVKKNEILLEHANPNTHKEIHVGHTRLLTLGAAILRILRASGERVVSISYINDVGANVGKTLWYFVQQEGIALSDLSLEDARRLIAKIKPEDQGGRLLGQWYSEATRLEAENPDIKKEISFVQQQLEAHVPSWEFLWRETQRWCVEELRRICDELRVPIDRQYFESDFLDRAHEIVDGMKRKGIVRESEGAEIVDLEDEKLGVFLLRKRDGTLLYSAKDLALAEQKAKDYPHAYESLYVVDSRQSLYLKQLFSVLRKLGYEQKLVHIAFEIVTLKEGVMSSRKGNIITYQAFRDAVLEEARKGIVERHPDWPDGKITHSAWAIGMAAIKFTMLKQDGDKKIVFDLQQALSFEGATGPYCQYAATRLASILRKAENPFREEGELSRAFDHASEKALSLALAKFPETVETAAKELRPAVVAQWCFDTAQKVNDFYRDVPVLESEGDLREGRLRLATAARQTLEIGLELLGIPLPDEM